MPPLTLEPMPTVGVLANPSGECAPQLLAIEAWAGAQGLRTVDLGTTDRAGEVPEAGGLVIALGGDGTILRALQLALVHHSPVLGVNFGHVGFLADIDGDELGHEDPRMTLTVYAQSMKRSQIDEALIWQLMRFPDETDERRHERSFGPTNDPTRARRSRR